jgi:hypothetical protein
VAAVAADDGEGEYTVYRSKSATKRDKKKEKAALAASVEPTAAVVGGGKGGGKPKTDGGKGGKKGEKTRFCYAFQTGECWRTAAECHYLHKTATKKQMEDQEKAKAKGKAARAASPAAGGKGKGGAKTGGKVPTIHIAAAATADTSGVCPLGMSCLDSTCWATLQHEGCAFVASPVYTDEQYIPLSPENSAYDQ